MALRTTIRNMSAEPSPEAAKSVSVFERWFRDRSLRHDRRQPPGDAGSSIISLAKKHASPSVYLDQRASESHTGYVAGPASRVRPLNPGIALQWAVYHFTQLCRRPAGPCTRQPAGPIPCYLSGWYRATNSGSNRRPKTRRLRTSFGGMSADGSGVCQC